MTNTPPSKKSRPGQAEWLAFAAAAPGLEPLLCFELRRLGMGGVRALEGGVAFRASWKEVQLANLWLHTAQRVLLRLAHFRADSFSMLERQARQVDWARWLRAGARLALSVTCHKSRLYHSTAVAERVVGAIARVTPGVQWVELEEAEAEAGDASPCVQRIFARLDRDQCTLSLDTSGERLHRRGYRRAIGQAPLRETLAAAVVLSGGLQARVPSLAVRRARAPDAGHRWLLDPMCGSGTILIEAARLLCHVAPGLGRSFAFERFPAHAPAQWRAMLDEARSRQIAPPDDFELEGRDIDGAAIRAAEINAANAGIPPDLITWRQAPLAALDAAASPGLIISNPPYGHRLGEVGALRDFYRDAGRAFCQRRAGSHLALLMPERGFEAALGLPLEPRLWTRNGNLAVRLYCGEIPHRH